MQHMCPQVIGIGASFSGLQLVTSLLTDHPAIANRIPSLDFFSTDAFSTKGAGWYEATCQDAAAGRVAIECSVSYFTHPAAPRRIVETCPKTKLLVVIDNPLYRAVAEYEHQRRSPKFNRRHTCGEYLHAHPRALERGLSAKHLAAYFAYYSPLQVHIIVADDLRDKPLETIQKLYRFIGVDAEFVPPILKPFAPPEEEPKYPSLIYKVKRFVRRWVKQHILPTPAVWSFSRPQLSRYFSDDELALWWQYYQADVAELSAFTYEDMIVRFAPPGLDAA